MKTFTELLPLFPNNQTILDTVAKTIDHIQDGKKIMVSVSGGSDSDIMVDLFEKIGYEPNQVVYVWFDTGLEYEATKRHLVFLEEKYGIEIQRHKAKTTIPLAIKRYGVPFMSKAVSSMIERLDSKGFCYEDDPIDSLLAKYKNAKTAIKWWCDSKKETRFTVDAFAGLKEFMMLEHPPKCSDKCCKYAKKDPAEKAAKSFGAELVCVGVRRAENGLRSSRFSTCFTPKVGNKEAQFRPIFFWTDADKAEYEEFCGVVHSDCYTVYGLRRTGCVGCPFGSKWEEELAAIKEYEPKLYTAACNIFGESYEYTRKYRKFKEAYKREKRKGGQIDLFDMEVLK